MSNILIVEDEQRLRKIIHDYFRAHGLHCTEAADGEEALAILREKDFDAVLLDIMMPRLDGFGVCKVVRQRSGVPILFLTALGDEEDMLQGYALGADDYITKPFSLAVLLAKTQAIIRRSRGTAERSVLCCGGITLDLTEQKCTVNAIPVKLTSGEFDLLMCLMRHQGQVLSRNQLLELVWNGNLEVDDRAVDVRIRSLRAALGDAGTQIKTVYKAGYRMEG